MGVKLKFKSGRGRQEKQPTYKKQQSYHYSSNRSNIDRLNQRRERTDNLDKAQASSKSKIGRLPNVVAGLLILAGILYMLNLNSNVIIKPSSGGNDFIGDKSLFQKKAEDYMRSSLLNHSKLTFDRHDMEAQLRDDFPELVDIKVSVYPLKQRPVIDVTFARPTLLISSGERLFVVAQNGITIAEVTNNKDIGVDTDSLPLVQDLSLLDLSVGQFGLGSDQVRYIDEVVYQSTQNDLSIKKMELVPGGGELRVYYGNVDYYVKYNFFEDARQSVGTAISMIDELEQKGIVPKQYIDVRVAERAYVK